MYEDWIKTRIGGESWIREHFCKHDMFKKIPLGSGYKFANARCVIRRNMIKYHGRVHGVQSTIDDFFKSFEYKM